VEAPPAADEDVSPQHRAPAGAGLAGVILCGGRSSRMGADKATIRFEGMTLLARAVARLDGVCDPVLIARGGTSATMTGREAIADAVPNAGPLGGLVAGLRHSPHRLLAVVAVDLPWVDPGLIRMLADLIGDRDVALCETGVGVEPLHAVYSTSILAVAETALAGPDRSLRRLIGAANALRIPESRWREAGFSERFALNVNTPEDLAEISRVGRR
jgi:molybdopterin-guanine dinucleotide biosynthesis protein A